ncbi:MAG: hypothetical protein ACRDSP_10490 [Pseudonocardiaceae bacterium]
MSRAYFTVGLVLGGSTIATLAVALGSLVRPALPPGVRVAVVAAVALFVLAGEVGLHRVALPHRRAQVPSAVIGGGGDAGALQFGFEMGSGVRTHMPSNLPYLVLVAVLLVSSWGAALLAGLGFGLGRAAMALGRHHSRDTDWWDSQWQRHGRRLRIVLTLAAALLMTGIMRGVGHPTHPVPPATTVSGSHGSQRVPSSSVNVSPPGAQLEQVGGGIPVSSCGGAVAGGTLHRVPGRRAVAGRRPA